MFWIVIYRAHGELAIETKHYGPFNDYMDAEDYLISLPALGYYDDELHAGQTGCKYIEQLIEPIVA